MSQQLTPVNGGITPEVQTTAAQPRLNVLSSQYIEVNNLHSRPTDWVPGGRPIYRRLPAISETYQINFFNLVTESNVTGNTTVRTNIEEIGYVYIPWGESINGGVSLEVSKSDNSRVMLIKSGAIVWKYGKTLVRPTIVDLQVLDVNRSVYDVAYQLIYDDSSTAEIYAVNDFALTGQPLNIIGSTDGVIGWRYPALNAFLNNTDLRWSNEDSYYPSYSQPSTAFLQWESELGSAYSSVTLRCPPGTAYSGTATLSYVNGGVLTPVSTVPVSRDSTGQFFTFAVTDPAMQTGWNVTFSSVTVSIQSITVSGTLTLTSPQASLSPRAALVMYPAGTLPKTIINGQGEEIPATYATLAQVSVDGNYSITDIQDTREIIRRDYVPVADWLTTPFDQDLINLYEQVSDYPSLWMAPTSCMKQEYANLRTDQIIVEA
jgi:hypothetical protein